ncbi:hypothetical protein AXF42_Ash015060 [Apostasia shenzhenica]|uniref:Uncharacterized protein n=1 Tax=Apostasia shenzhenica TaxID=1088818 RepID=A0A2I0B318_9ASPA|nr:hypothetical protein AXF42_Ash015060 [Apostasia shenzhenica]
MLVLFWGRVSVRKSTGPVGRHVFGQDAAQEPRINISPPHCQGANINMGPGMRTIAKVDALPEVCKDKMGVESVALHSILHLSVEFCNSVSASRRDGGEEVEDRLWLL